MSLRFTLLVSLLALGAASNLLSATMEKDMQALNAEAGGPRTITRVVKLLQDMLETSKTEGDEEREIFAKFKCYCDTNEADKKDSIESLGKKIEILTSRIEELQGDNGELSTACAELTADIAANKQAYADADAVREKQNKAFKDFKSDSEQAIDQMKNALETLSEVGGDQTKSAGADTKQFMAKASALVALKTQVDKALKVAAVFLDAGGKKKVDSFLQAPFTGTYTSQSGAVVGILKEMRDTFKKNLADAIETEKEQKESFEAYEKLSKEELKLMKESLDKKQAKLGINDGDLGSKKKQLAKAKDTKADDEEFLYDQLIPLCETKAKSYEERKVMRTNEEAAIAECISILNSDAAFATFQDTDAGTTGFIQLRAVRRHVVGRKQTETAQDVLSKAARATSSGRLNKVVSMIKADNPFTEVLEEIDHMLELIKDEGKADKENLDWCIDERKETNQVIKEKKAEILRLNKKIDTLDNTINAEDSGLKDQITKMEDLLTKNLASQKEETAERTEDNLAYQKDVKNLVEAADIIKQGLKVLKAYYKKMEENVDDGMGNNEISAESAKIAPDAPSTPGDYDGQSSGGNKAINMLEFIHKETVKEEMEAHDHEKTEQHAFEDSMKSLTDDEKKYETTLSKLRETLAQKEAELLDAEEDLKDTKAVKKGKVDYLKKIKPGCDFITKYFDTREKNRATEKSALKKAIRLIKATPVYKDAIRAEEVEGFGDCKSCEDAPKHVECKACMADVTEPAYCAGHKGTPGC